MKNNGHATQCLSRRDFLVRGAKAMAVLAAAGGGAYGLLAHSWKNIPDRGSARNDMGDFRVLRSEQRIAIVAGTDRRRALKTALEAIGGLGVFIKPGDRVALKVNAAFATAPALGATTHPDLVEEMARLCWNAGASEVIVFDHPINDPASCFRYSGIGAAAAAAGARLWAPQPADFEALSSSQGRLLRDWPVFVAPLRRATKLIGLAPVKDHARSGGSMTLKNWYGLLGGPRALFHQSVHELIAELASWIRPTFVVLDGTVTMYRNGPTGGSLSDLKPTQRLVVSSDPVAADAYGASLLGRKPSDFPFIMQAAAAGVGTASYELLNPIEVTLRS